MIPVIGGYGDGQKVTDYPMPPRDYWEVAEPPDPDHDWSNPPSIMITRHSVYRLEKLGQFYIYVEKDMSLDDAQARLLKKYVK